MIKEAFEGFAAGRGYKRLGDAAFGVYKGYPFHANLQTAGKGAVAFAFRLEGTAAAADLKALRKELPKGYSLATPAKGQYNLICDGARRKGMDAGFSAALDLVTAAFRELGLRPPETCPLCGRGGCDCLALVNGYVPAHRDCLEGQAAQTARRAERNLAGGNYVTGFIGAIIGGIVGALPTVLTALWLGRIFSLLYALIPICAYYGYKLLKGKMNRGAFVCTLISSVLGLFSIHFFTNYITLCRVLGRVVEPSVGLRMYTEAVAAGSLTPALVQSAVFLLLGLWISWGIVTRTAGHEVRRASSVLETVTPLDGQSAAASDAPPPPPSPSF